MSDREEFLRTQRVVTTGLLEMLDLLDAKRPSGVYGLRLFAFLALARALAKEGNSADYLHRHVQAEFDHAKGLPIDRNAEAILSRYVF